MRSANMIYQVFACTVQKMKNTCDRIDETLDNINEHMPAMASSVNLTGLEMADCIVEFSELSRELTGGLKAGARTLQASEQMVRSGGQAMRQAMKDVVVPGFKERVVASARALSCCCTQCHRCSFCCSLCQGASARSSLVLSSSRTMVPTQARAAADIIDHVLTTNAQLDRDPSIAEAAAATKQSIRDVRSAVAATRAAGQVVSFGAAALASAAGKKSAQAAAEVAGVQTAVSVAPTDAEQAIVPTGGWGQAVSAGTPSLSVTWRGHGEQAADAAADSAEEQASAARDAWAQLQDGAS